MKIITGTGLWVASSFTEKFGSKDVKPAKSAPPFKTLTKSMKDTDIKKEVGESTLQDVAAFLENPPEGTKDGYWNIFYVAGCVVRVDWNADFREWHVYAWELGDVRWGAGRRAFGRNCHSDSLASSDPLDSMSLSLEQRVAALEAWRERVQ